MRKTMILVVIAATVATSGCNLVRRKGGDEFAVAKSAPLVVPPDFSLAPPVTGAGISPADAQQQAIDTLFGGPAPRPQYETSLLESAGGSIAKVGIRSTVWDPDTRIVDKGETTLAILSAQQTRTDVARANVGQ
jgi:hypothetical protein